MVEDIQQFVKNKRIVFVGNSVEIMKHKLGKTIDSYDIIVRFGRAISATPEQEKSIGEKCDIWVTGQFRAPEWYKNKNRFEKGKFKKSKILVNRCRGNLQLKNWEIEKRLPQGMLYTMMYTDEEIIDIMSMFGKDMLSNDLRPSAGFITLLWFLQKVKTYKSIDLIGFDFFAKTVSVPGLSDKAGRLSAADPHSWHLPCYAMQKSAHDKNLEQEYVSFLKRKGDINWHLLSDLDTKLLKYDGWMTDEKLIRSAPKYSKVSKI